MEASFGDLTLNTRSDLINRAFASDKPSPYTSMSQLRDFPVISTPYSRQSTFDEYQRQTTVRSNVSLPDSLETTHTDNVNEPTWANVVELNTPTQTGHADEDLDKNGANLLRVIKTIFTENVLDVFRSYVEELFEKDSKSMMLQYDSKKILLDVDGFRVRVFAILRKCIANNTEANIVRIFEALRGKYDVQLIEEIPSIGSITHSNGYCKPCVFANKAVNSCKNGTECNFCHIQHKLSRKKSGSKENAETPKQAKSKTQPNLDNWMETPTSPAKKDHVPGLETRNASTQTDYLEEETPTRSSIGWMKSSPMERSRIRDKTKPSSIEYPNVGEADAIDLIEIMNDALATKCLEYLDMEHNDGTHF